MALDLERFFVWLLGRSAWPLIWALAMLGVLCLSCGCNGDVRLTKPQAQELAQAQADSGALVQYYKSLGNPDAMLTDLIQATNFRLAAALTNVQDMPAPKTAVPSLLIPSVAHEENHSAEASAAKPPEGVSAIGWATMASVGLGLLWAVGRIAPSVPGVGPLAGTLADGLWAIFAHKNQKAADTGKDAVQTAAMAALPALALVRAQPGLPAPAMAALGTLAQAVQALQPGGDGPAASIPSGSVGPGASG